MERSKGLNRWKVSDSVDLYHVDKWGAGYFDVNEAGEVTILLRDSDGLPHPTSLMHVVDGLTDRGIGLPVLLRFPDIIRQEIFNLNSVFRKKIEEYEYTGQYRGVYPIKVNQQQQVIEEIAKSGAVFNHGFEAGSKAELFIALAYNGTSDGLIICNGFKDDEFVELALYGNKMGKNIILVVERPGELERIINSSERLGVRPRLGIRVKLSSTVGGRWSESAGDHSIFGLTSSQIIDAVDLLKAEALLDRLELLHYHLGSQIPDIRNIRQAVTEATRYYISLHAEGVNLRYLDVGGGLAVNYDGSATTYDSSCNYTVEEYASDIIEIIQSATAEAGVPPPTIVTETGRALTAYSSVLLFNILDTNRLDYQDVPAQIPGNSHFLLENMLEVYSNLNVKNLQESYHDALFYRDEIRTRFLSDEIGLRERGMGDQIFWKIIDKISALAKSLKFPPVELQNLDVALADIYYGNFSLFQSLPDSWAIEQLFPIAPIHRLDQEPTEPAIIADTTCDCDGKIDKFISLYEVERSLPLHPFTGDPYIIGVFIIGAYQETLGDLHNLFGDSNVVSISAGSNGNIQYKKELDGDSVADVLSYVEYSPADIIERLREAAETAVETEAISPQERKTILEYFREGLRGYTYFES